MRARFLLTLGVGIMIGSTLSSMVALAWTGPTASPPNNNVNGVIVTVGDQIINGILSLNGTVIYGNTLLSGSNRYINFGSASGSGGYGIRDNAGILEFKSSGGSWASLSASWVNLSTLNGVTPNGLGQITSIKFSDGTTQTTAASAGSSLTSFYGGNVPSGASYYYCFNCQNGSPDPSYAQAAMPRADVAQSLFVTVNAYPQPSTGTLVVTLRKNGANTPLSVTIPAGSPIGYVGSDTTHTVSFSAGDIIDIMATNNASASSCNFRGSMAM